MRPSGLISVVTRKSWAILPAKKMPDRSTPTSTPMARLWVQTTVTTVASMTMEEERGWTASAVIEDQEKVPIETMIMIATRAGMGMMLTRSPRPTTRISRTTPAVKEESRPRPPDFHVDDRLADHGAARHAADEAGGGVGQPLPTHSWLRSDLVSVRSSTMFWVIKAFRAGPRRRQQRNRGR